jgi:hypothetical protein
MTNSAIDRRVQFRIGGTSPRVIDGPGGTIADYDTLRPGVRLRNRNLLRAAIAAGRNGMFRPSAKSSPGTIW